MTEQLTVAVVPRDRFSSVVDCIRSVVANTPKPFRLAVLDLGYGPRTLRRLQEAVADVPLEVVDCGRVIPVVAFRDYLSKVVTPYVAWVDNDTFVTPGWATALLERARAGARVVMPVTLEREGLDPDPRKIPLRNHISHSELRSKVVNGVEYAIDYKPFRRAAPSEIPAEPHTVDFFELHAVFAETEVLRALDWPEMVVREHIDLGIQLHRKGIEIWCEPTAIVQFDNIHGRPTWRDFRFFCFRWQEPFINQSHQLFLERWGYRFANEQFMKNWAYRRKVYSFCRLVGVPQRPADLTARVLNRLFRPRVPAELSRISVENSSRVFDQSAVPSA
jgi:hypothetical protein